MRYWHTDLLEHGLDLLEQKKLALTIMGGSFEQFTNRKLTLIIDTGTTVELEKWRFKMEEQTLLRLPSRRLWDSVEPFNKLFQQLRDEFHGRTMHLHYNGRAEQPTRHYPFELHLEDLQRNVLHIVPYTISRSFLLHVGVVTATISETKELEFKKKEPVQAFQLLILAQVSIDPI